MKTTNSKSSYSQITATRTSPTGQELRFVHSSKGTTGDSYISKYGRLHLVATFQIDSDTIIVKIEETGTVKTHPVTDTSVSGLIFQIEKAVWNTLFVDWNN